MKTTFLNNMYRCLVVLLLLCQPHQALTQMPKKAETVAINGKNMYYEVHGEGSPLLLLHGYAQSSKDWQEYIADFAKDFEVYLIDLPGHGKSSAFTKSMVISEVAEDLNALVTALKLEKVKAIGFSFGGDVLFQLNLINPELVEKMVIIGSLGTWSIKEHPEVAESFTFDNQAYRDYVWPYHESEDQIKALFREFLNYEVALSDQDLQSIRAKVLLVCGDQDSATPIDEIARVRKFLPNSQLWVLPNVPHSAHKGENKVDFVKKARSFLLE